MESNQFFNQDMNPSDFQITFEDTIRKYHGKMDYSQWENDALSLTMH